MQPEPPRNERPQIEGPGQFTMPVMRSRVIEAFRVTLTQYTQHANCSEMDLSVDLVDKNPSMYLGRLDLQVTIPGYRVWRNNGQTSQHAVLLHHIVSPRLPDDGLAGLTVNIFMFSLGMDRLCEQQGWTLVEIPKLQITL